MGFMVVLIVSSIVAVPTPMAMVRMITYATCFGRQQHSTTHSVRRLQHRHVTKLLLSNGTLTASQSIMLCEHCKYIDESLVLLLDTKARTSRLQTPPCLDID